MSIILLVIAAAAAVHMLLAAQGPFDPPALPWTFAVVGLLLVRAVRLARQRGTGRTVRFSFIDAAAAGLVAAGLAVLIFRLARGAGTDAAREFGVLFFASLMYVPARLAIRTPAQARVAIAGALVLCAAVALASVPSALDAARDAFMMRRAAEASAFDARPLGDGLAPDGWTLTANAAASRVAGEGESAFLRITAGPGEAEFRFAVPRWFAVAGEPLSASALLRGTGANHVDLQLFQGSRSVSSSRYRPTGDWQTLETEFTPAETSEDVGLDLNISPAASIDVESIRLAGTKGVLRAIGAETVIWEPAGWRLLQAGGRAERVAAAAGERVRLTATSGEVDFRGDVPADGAAGEAVTVTAQVFARGPILHLQLLSGDRVIDTAKHLGSGWETLVVSGTASSGRAAVDVDLRPGQAEIQSVTLQSRGATSTLLGTVVDITRLEEPAVPPAPAPPPPAPIQAPSYRERVDRLPSAVVATLACLFAVALASLARRAVLAARIRDRLLVAVLTLLALVAVAAASYVPSLSHPGMAFAVWIAMAAVHPLPLQGEA